MMTASELTTCRNLLDMLQDCNGEVADYWQRMLEHIDEQAIQITTMQENFTEFMMNGPCDKHSGDNTPPLPEFLKKIDGKCMLCMIKQLATLKVSLIDDRSELILCSPSYSLWRYQNNIDRIESQDDWKPIKAKAMEELAQEYPDIFKEE